MVVLVTAADADAATARSARDAVLRIISIPPPGLDERGNLPNFPARPPPPLSLPLPMCLDDVPPAAAVEAHRRAHLRALLLLLGGAAPRVVRVAQDPGATSILLW